MQVWMSNKWKYHARLVQSVLSIWNHPFLSTLSSLFENPFSSVGAWGRILNTCACQIHDGLNRDEWLLSVLFFWEMGCSIARVELWLFGLECWFRNNSEMCEGGSAFCENGMDCSDNMEGMVYTKQITKIPPPKKNSLGQHARAQGSWN